MNDLPAGILIDLDDTILDDSGRVEACWADACAEAARRVPGLDASALQEAIAVHASWWWSDSERIKRGRLDLQAATLEILGDVMRRQGCTDADIVTDIAKFYRALRNERATVFEGAIETLEELRAAVEREAPFVGVKPYSHNIIGIVLGIIAREHGQKEANAAIMEFGLEALGWSVQKE